MKEIRLQGFAITAEVELALSRMLVHLQRDEFEPCHDILDGLEAEWKVRGRVDGEALNCIASLNLGMREINLLEDAGFLYVTDMDGIDLERLRLPNMGQIERERVRTTIEGARERLKEEERRSIAEKIELTRGVDA